MNLPLRYVLQPERPGGCYQALGMGILTVYESSGSEGERAKPLAERDACLKAVRDTKGNFQRADEFLQQLGLRLQPAPKDGKCQFQALSASAQAQGWDVGAAAAVRKLVCCQLKHNDGAWSPFVTEDYAGYVQSMKRDGAYCDHLTLQCFAQQTGFFIHVYALEGLNGKAPLSPPQDDHRPER